jgi:hypothetical protein
MNAPLLRIVAVGLLLIFIFASGVALSRTGRPINTALLTVHKLIVVGTVVFLGVIAHRANQAAPLSAVELAVVVVTAVLFLAMIASGGMLSVEKPAPAVVLRLHQIVPFLAVLATGGTLYTVLARA